MEWASAGEQLVQHHAEGPDIGALVHDLSARLLWRHVCGRTHNHSCSRRRDRHGGRRLWVTRGKLNRLCQSEVEYLHRAVGFDFNIGGFEIAMDDAFQVRSVES